MIINWSEEYSVGINEIDTQHKRLVELINKLHDAMSQGKSREIASEILSDLTNYTQTHFKFEEEKFAKYNYEHRLIHELEHKKFVDKITEFKTDFENGKALISIELMNFLKDWLINHIKVSDKK